MNELSFEDRWRIYETVVYMAWGDQHLAASEVSLARAIAEELDLDREARSAGWVLRRGPPMLGDIGLEQLGSRARHVAYATAAWMAFADGHEHPAERAVLLTLRYRLKLDDTTAALLESSALLIHAQRHVTAPRSCYRALLHAIEDVLGPDEDDSPTISGSSPGREDSTRSRAAQRSTRTPSVHASSVRPSGSSIEVFTPRRCMK